MHLSSPSWLLQWAPPWKSLRIEGGRWPHKEAAPGEDEALFQHLENLGGETALPFHLCCILWPTSQGWGSKDRCGPAASIA